MDACAKVFRDDRLLKDVRIVLLGALEEIQKTSLLLQLDFIGYRKTVFREIIILLYFLGRR